MGRGRVWFHRSRSVAWILAGAAALIWWRESIAFVIIASVYANVASDWASSEAADDRAVLERLDRIEQLLRPSKEPPWP